MVFHGRAHSHIDALCHRFYKEQMYNGFSYQEVTKEGGCAKNDIQNLQNGIITRGILIDIPRLKGVPYLDPLTPVFPEDIEAWEKKAGIKVAAGDAILLRTGRWARRAKLGPFVDFAGYHAMVVPWLKARDVALIGSDGIQDIGELPVIGSPIHTFAIVGLGATLLDNLDLEAVAETAAKLNRWEFLLTAAPIPVEGGTGSPLNPVAPFLTECIGVVLSLGYDREPSAPADVADGRAATVDLALTAPQVVMKPKGKSPEMSSEGMNAAPPPPLPETTGL